MRMRSVVTPVLIDGNVAIVVFNVSKKDIQLDDLRSIHTTHIISTSKSLVQPLLQYFSFEYHQAERHLIFSDKIGTSRAPMRF